MNSSGKEKAHQFEGINVIRNKQGTGHVGKNLSGVVNDPPKVTTLDRLATTTPSKDSSRMIFDRI